MNKIINLNEGGEGTWKIPKENQTNVLDKVSLDFEDGERPDKYDSSRVEEMSEEVEQKIGEFQRMVRLNALKTGRKVHEVLLAEEGDDEPM